VVVLVAFLVELDFDGEVKGKVMKMIMIL